MPRDRHKPERGAALVEMALVAPFLLLLILGIIEFGYLFGEFNEVRHAAREGARFAAVSNADVIDLNSNGVVDNEDVYEATCNAIDLPGATSIDIQTTLSGSSIGNLATINVTANVTSLSKAPIIANFLPSQLSNTATFRLEQPATWTAATANDIC